MRAREHILRWLTVIALLVGVPAAALTGLSRVQVQTDITAAMPSKDPVVASAKRILGRHPALDMVTIDLGLDRGPAAPDRLVAAARLVAARLEASALFTRVGTEDAARSLPRLLAEVARGLPLLFDPEELEREIAWRLRPEAVRAALARDLEQLSDLQGVGQAELITADPLGLREPVLARLAALNPAPGAQIYKGQLLSADGRHLLLVADPKGAGSDTAQARKITSLLDSIQAELPAAIGSGPAVRLRAVGAFRAALDNETIVRADTNRAVWVATLGVALLLLLCFGRPWLGLLALVPAICGAACALWVYSWFEPSISALALGFGGALITITVDHGIAYLQFLDRPVATTGRGAAHEVWKVGLFAGLTTVAAFLALYLSGFEMLGQVGLFAALGVGLSFAFVHLVFPLLFPRLRPSKRRALLPLPRLLAAVCVRRGWLAAGLFGLAAVALALIGRPEYRVDLQAMNTVTPETLAAEQALTEVWGKVFDRTYVMLEAGSEAELRAKTDGLAELLANQRRSGGLASGFSPSQVLPGPDLAAKHLEAWKAFFTPARVAAVAAELRTAGSALGFADGAFDGFLESLRDPHPRPPGLPGPLARLLGAARSGDGWLWLGAVEPGPAYDAEAFSRAAAGLGLSVFDPGLFTHRLSGLLGAAFTEMLWVIGLAVVVLLAILFFDPLLVATALAPLGFALACTLGCMHLSGHPIDIPGLMLAIVVLGMGVDYALYFVRAQQRYYSPEAVELGPVRVAVFLAAGSTLVGLGTLAMARHAVPRSAGLTTLMGIGFALIGTFALLPPILNRLFAARPFEPVDAAPGSAVHRRRVRARYRHLEPGVRLAARFKLRLDPMFDRLAELVGPPGRVTHLLDVGCGFGLPAAWLLAIRPELVVHGLEPDPERARVARRVLGERGTVDQAPAPDWEGSSKSYDAALMLDVVHHLTDEALAATLGRIRAQLANGGRLVIRADVPAKGRIAWERWLETARLRLRGLRPRFRTLCELKAALVAAGFSIALCEPSAPRREETWLVGVAGPAGEAP